MRKEEILQCAAQAHNKIAQIPVSGEGAILMGEALKLLRTAVFALQDEVDAGESAEQEEGVDG